MLALATTGDGSHAICQFISLAALATPARSFVYNKRSGPILGTGELREGRPPDGPASSWGRDYGTMK
jgi:hypothetical protein